MSCFAEMPHNTYALADEFSGLSKAGSALYDEELLELVEKTNIPFLPTPMGKGCIPDDHPNFVMPARSTALKGADVVLLVGARAARRLALAVAF